MDIKLSSKKILDKDFKTGIRGYSQDEVDQFLDEIISDYENFEKVLVKKQEEIQLLKQELEQAVSNRRGYESPTTVAPTATGATNYDILKRIANLEKHVFGDKLYD
ncbi:cell cycle protein GpsB [Kurthia sibirica]|uniref:Cell division regulator GpsB n=2 Tax=Kurthia sibirica TaxID=202750 RepID=A0A2U3AI81_9BACL|nr:cell division regulator GpsB [Kurthia sibirica]GEK34114.1 cell cycle protein GpsB [Kurthia sibirica]